MAKLSKLDSKKHEECESLLAGSSPLSPDEREFIFTHWRADARHMNGTAGAFFTPPALARDLAIEVPVRGPSPRHKTPPKPVSVVDLCAGIGVLGYYTWLSSGRESEITCVEINPDYVAVGRRVFPEARWICNDAFNHCPAAPLLLQETAKPYDVAISNPPFNRVSTHRNTYGCFEYDLIAHAAGLAEHGAFLIPQDKTPFRLSGGRGYSVVSNSAYEQFRRRTGITLTAGCGVDTDVHAKDWTIKVPVLEIALGFSEDF